MRARQLQRRDEDLEEAVLHLQRMRLEGKERHDEKHGIRNEELAIESVVLLHDTRREKDVAETGLQMARSIPNLQLCERKRDVYA